MEWAFLWIFGSMMTILIYINIKFDWFGRLVEIFKQLLRPTRDVPRGLDYEYIDRLEYELRMGQYDPGPEPEPRGLEDARPAFWGAEEIRAWGEAEPIRKIDCTRRDPAPKMPETPRPQTDLKMSRNDLNALRSRLPKL